MLYLNRATIIITIKIISNMFCPFNITLIKDTIVHEIMTSITLHILSEHRAGRGLQAV